MIGIWVCVRVCVVFVDAFCVLVVTDGIYISCSKEEEGTMKNEEQLTAQALLYRIQFWSFLRLFWIELLRLGMASLTVSMRHA